jgi:hypothetical protein
LSKVPPLFQAFARVYVAILFPPSDVEVNRM